MACGRAGISTLVSSTLLVLLSRCRRLIDGSGADVAGVDVGGAGVSDDLLESKAFRISSSLIATSSSISSSSELDSDGLK